jgi:hypothetical protein
VELQDKTCLPCFSPVPLLCLAFLPVALRWLCCSGKTNISLSLFHAGVLATLSKRAAKEADKTSFLCYFPLVLTAFAFAEPVPDLYDFSSSFFLHFVMTVHEHFG